ncbi:MAG: ribonuclease P protein component [Planctomycetes bacterium]|nr:ribonuclease P protein component [Planctomycetota bacterium]
MATSAGDLARSTACDASSPDEHAPDQRYPRTERLRRRSEFLRVQQHGARYRGRHVTVLSVPAAMAHTRFGVTVSKKVGDSPTRALVKRRLREIYRTNKPAWPSPVDFVVVAKPSAASATFDELTADLLAWARRQTAPSPDTTP